MRKIPLEATLPLSSGGNHVLKMPAILDPLVQAGGPVFPGGGSSAGMIVPQGNSGHSSLRGEFHQRALMTIPLTLHFGLRLGYWSAHWFYFMSAISPLWNAPRTDT